MYIYIYIYFLFQIHDTGAASHKKKKKKRRDTQIDCERIIKVEHNSNETTGLQLSIDNTEQILLSSDKDQVQDVSKKKKKKRKSKVKVEDYGEDGELRTVDSIGSEFQEKGEHLENDSRKEKKKKKKKGNMSGLEGTKELQMNGRVVGGIDARDMNGESSRLVSQNNDDLENIHVASRHEASHIKKSKKKKRILPGLEGTQSQEIRVGSE